VEIPVFFILDMPLNLWPSGFNRTIVPKDWVRPKLRDFSPEEKEAVNRLLLWRKLFAVKPYANDFPLEECKPGTFFITFDWLLCIF